MDKNIIVMKSEKLSNIYEERFVIIDKDTGEIFDDAQGYGYKTVQKAYAAYNYINNNKERHQQKERQILQWLKEHKDFVRVMDMCEDSALIKKRLADKGLNPNCTVKELLRVWRKNNVQLVNKQHY